MKHNLEKHCQCKFCRKIFNDKVDCIGHAINQHPRCKQCGRRFIDKRALQKHLWDVHHIEYYC
jgi:hypothetical protein